jgi:3-dehydroquinate dehydratase/shikimate dehydrogenase
MNRLYLKCPVRAGHESFKAFLVEVRSRPWLGFRGFSVTIPHKENALRHLDECGGRLTDDARRVGAVNTIAIDDDATLTGHNTDLAAAVACMEAACGGGVDALRGRHALVLGAGGVARAVVAGLIDRGASALIANRTDARATALAAEFGGAAVAWAQRHRSASRADLIVNCSSVGMWPNVDQSPISADAISHGPAVVDAVYRPRKTRLLSDAMARRCVTVDGLAMFARQAAEQFRIWTGQQVDWDQLVQFADDRLSRV